MKIHEAIQKMLNVITDNHKLNTKMKRIQAQMSDVSKLPYPEWIIKKYLVIHSVFGYGKFTQEEVSKILKVSGVRMVLAELKKFELLDSEPNPADVRSKIYKLREFEVDEKDDN